MYFGFWNPFLKTCFTTTFINFVKTKNCKYSLSMNKSACENRIPKCIMLSLEKNPEKSRFYQKLPEYTLERSISFRDLDMLQNFVHTCVAVSNFVCEKRPRYILRSRRNSRPREHMHACTKTVLPGRSCLLARIKMGTPALSGLLAVLVSSIFASSSRSASQESTTKIIPSVHRV